MAENSAKWGTYLKRIERKVQGRFALEVGRPTWALHTLIKFIINEDL